MFIDAIPEALLGALAFTTLCLAPGLAWVWTLAPRSRFETTVLALALGLPLTVLPAVVLAEWGRFSAGALWTIAAVLTMAGLFIGRARHARDALPGALLMALILALLWALPPRGEWLLGGWDPGVNTNQGLLLARTGSVAQPEDPLRAEALRAAHGAFARPAHGFTEAFPGLPANPETGALEPYFYRATPTLIAIVDTVAGRNAALHANQIAALAAGLLFAAFLRAAGVRRAWIGLAGGALLLLHPLVLAHHGNPASEMLELAVVCATGFLLLRPRDRPHAILLFLVLLLGAMNRVSFLFHSAILLLILVPWDAQEDDRSAVSMRHLAVAAALACGLAWYAWITPESLVKVRHLLPALHAAAGISVAVALVVDGALMPGRRADAARPIRRPKGLRVGVLLVPASLLIREFARSDAWVEFLRNAPAWFAYAPPALALIGVMGLLWRGIRSAAAPWLLWLSCALLAVLLHRHAAELYPWATKRWLAWSPPLLIAGVSLLADHLSPRFGRAGRASVISILGLVLAGMLPASLSAWNTGDHKGAGRTLDQVAGHLQPDDLVVADDFLWATPLALVHGFTVLNAAPLIKGRAEPDPAARFLASTDRRVVLLSSTRRGLAGWPEPFRHARALHDPIRFRTRELIHDRSHRPFQTREQAYTLQLYVWEPAR
jgi:hypothetical protein